MLKFVLIFVFSFSFYSKTSAYTSAPSSTWGCRALDTSTHMHQRSAPSVHSVNAFSSRIDGEVELSLHY